MRERYVADACADFARRLAPYFPLEIAEVRASSATPSEAAVREEGERLLKALDSAEHVWLLDPRGEEFGSEALSRRISTLADSGVRRLTLVVAGTFGAADALRERANLVWSLSQLTFLHEWARAIVLEQLYRAAKIARNEPYHH